MRRLLRVCTRPILNVRALDALDALDKLDAFRYFQMRSFEAPKALRSHAVLLTSKLAMMQLRYMPK